MPLTVTTDLPPPSNFSIDDIDGAGYIVSWDSNSNNGSIEVSISANGGESFVTDALVDHSNTTHTTSDYLSENEHIMKIRATTEHVNSTYSNEITEVLAGSVLRLDGLGLRTEQSGEVLTE